MFRADTVMATKPYSRELGNRMAERLVRALRREPSVCWLFCAPGNGMEDLLKGICEVVRTDNVVGCTSDGEICSSGVATDSAVLGGISTDRMNFHVAFTENIGHDSYDSGRRLAAQLPEATTYIQLFTDGITGNGSAIIKGVGEVLGERLSIAGGTAGDNGTFRRTWQFAGDRLLTDAAVAIAFEGDFVVGTGVRSGWMPIGLPKTVTKSEGNILYELNGEPALRVYERFLGKHADKLPSIGVEYPLGLIGKEGDVGEPDYFLLRATMSVDRDKNSIHFAGDIPEGSMVNLTCGDTQSILNAAGEAAKQALSRLSGRTPVMLFCYSCMARKIVLGRRTKQEVDRIREGIGPSLPLLGFYTYGEFCPVRSGEPSYFHNETITISILGE